jgi:hypothetical protein
MTFLELLVGMTIASFIMAGLLGLFVSESRLFGDWESRRTARDVVRGASQLLSADLRRLEATGGVEAVSPSAITIRSPFAMGIVCASTAASTTASLLPTDSVMYESAAPSGYAWRTSTGYAYQTSLTSLTEGSAALCTAANITTLPGGSVVAVAPGAGATVRAGTPLLLYQRVTYEFASGADGSVLTRRLLSGGGAKEAVAETFVSSGTRFRFFVGSSDVAQDSVPADLSTIRGIELVLEGKGTYATPGGSVPSNELSQRVFFRNPPS